MHISDLSMQMKTELARSGSTEPLGVGNATPGEVLWRAKWASLKATATLSKNQSPNGGLSFCCVLGSIGAHQNT
jgi:hypothetical protein